MSISSSYQRLPDRDRDPPSGIGGAAPSPVLGGPSSPHHQHLQMHHGSPPQHQHPAAAAQSSASAALATWENLRRQARRLENDVEARLVTFARIGSSLASGPSASSSSSNAAQGVASSSSSSASASASGAGWAQAEAVDAEIDDLLKKLTSVVNLMAQCLEGSSMSATNPPMMHMLQRHRDILYDFAKEFKRTKTNISAARNHADLLGSIRDDINSYKASNAQEYMLNERSKIDNSHKLADIVLDQAYESRESLVNQGRNLFSSRSKITAALSRFPLINGLLGKINSKKRRDTIVLGATIGICTCLLLWFIFG